MVQVRPLELPPSSAPPIPPAWLSAAELPVYPAFVAGPNAVGDGGSEAAALRELESELEQLRAQAVEEGRSAGEAAGLSRHEEALARLGSLIVDLAEARELALVGVEEQLAELAVAIARALVGDALAAEPLLRELVREALDLVGEADEVVVRVNQRDADMIRREIAVSEESRPRSSRVRVQVDSSIEQGCIVDTRLAQVDATVAGRLERVRATLLTAGES